MKKKEIFYILLGITIGNALSLFMTLYLWGNAWWQVVIAIFAGTFVGAMVTDFKLFKQFALESHKESIVLTEKIWSKSFWQIEAKPSKKTLYSIHNFLLGVILLIGGVYLEILLIFIGKTETPRWVIELSPFSVIMFGVFYFYLSLTLINIIGQRSSMIKAFNEYEDGFKKNSDKVVRYMALNDYSFLLFLKKLWYAKWLDFIGLWKPMLKITLTIVFGLILVVIVWLPLILFISLKNMLKYNQILLVFLGVTTGTITGAVTMNIVFGFVAGIIPVFLAILFNVIASDFNYNDSKKVFNPIENFI